MKIKSILTLFTLLLIMSTLAFSQSKETGAIQGNIFDEEGVPLPGVTVTLSSPNLQGTRTGTTDEKGFYRFPSLPVGLYQIEAELSGFAAVVQQNIRLHTTETITVDLTMKPEVIEEEVTVIAVSPTIDVKSTETASITLTDELLRNIPYSQFTADIVDLAPGVFAGVAYGASSDQGIAYQVDGVDVSDPDGGTAWVFMDHNIIEEAKIMGIGLPAEYGAFTGVIFNLVTKSGGNEFSGHFEFDYQGKKDDWPKGLWQTENNEAYLDDFPDFTSPLTKLLDINGHLGGPIIKDKLWFYTGAQWYRDWYYPAGFPEAVDYKQPRAFIKLTGQLTASTSINTFFEYDAYNGVNRSAAANRLPEACRSQDSPDYTGNLSLTHIFSPKTFIDLKAAFFHGYYYLIPNGGQEKASYYSYDTRTYYGNYHAFGYYDRDRFQGNAALTHYEEDFIQGSHDFKLGVELEHGRSRNRYWYTGPDYTRYWIRNGQNYRARKYEGEDINTRYTRLEGYAQDSWKITDRLNLSLGARLSQNWGTIKNVGTVYQTFRIAPRIGFTYDILGDRTTVFKAHYGQFTEAMYASFHDRLNPAEAYNDLIYYSWDKTAQQWYETHRSVYAEMYEIADGIKHPYMDQFTVSIERELFANASLSVSFIYRNWKNIIGVYNTTGEYEQITIYDFVTGDPYTVWNQTTDPADDHIVIANIKKGDPWILDDPYRRYMGIEILFKKRFSNKWQMQASYIYSQTKGTINTGWGDDIGWSGWGERHQYDPNFWINADGNCTGDRTHQIKIGATYVLPLDINLTAFFRAISGARWARMYEDWLDQGWVDIFTEPRGSQRYDMRTILDLRVEKTFTFAGKYRLGFLVDIFNVFNDDTITSWGDIVGWDWWPGDYPSTDGHELYSIVQPRQARVGIRLMF